MSNSRKESTKKALEGYFERQARKEAPKRKNSQPEREVEKAILKWAEDKGWLLVKVEAKAVYSAQAGRYLHSQTSVGLPDLIGSTNIGRAVFLEVKAPGRRSTLRDGQRRFLTELIARNGFALVCDSVDQLEKAYSQWNEECSQSRGKKFLLSQLPQPKKVKDESSPLFSDV
jgi:hypothetical protein